MSSKRHTTTPTNEKRVLALARDKRMLRAHDLTPFGISREVLRRLEASGQLERRARGIYAPTDVPPTEQATLVAATVRVRHAVVCLLSALRFHDLTTQNPSEVWLAIDRKAWSPMVRDLPLRIVRFSGRALTMGVERHIVDGVKIAVYGPAKTVADCFKYRRKVGTDVAIEVLQEVWRSRRSSIDELAKYAAICRVSNVMRPYLESITANGR
ncbi:MAG: type IV toxin-antitoxin system AbiEi family antitoxin domain-containing protein [Gemmatimonadota bacterium]|nr:type IV toxin-antitoxin system AbiEi family antitoxin domain-containing protein [Gemmatimonadota bacterium]